jgi:hypothetical protein
VSIIASALGTVAPVKPTEIVFICSFVMNAFWFSILKPAFFRKVAEIKKLRGGMLSCTAQAILCSCHARGVLELKLRKRAVYGRKRN